jgi:hypothetical protein
VQLLVIYLITCGYPDSSQGIGVNFIFFYESLALFVDVDATVLAVMDFIVPHDWITVGADLYACQSVAVNIVVLNQTAAFSKYVNATLVAVVDFIPTDGRI